MLYSNKQRRLPGYDYRSPGFYFITINAYQRKHHFGTIREGRMGLSSLGCLAARCWQEIPDHHDHVSIDEFIIMPDHMHGILCIDRWYVSPPQEADLPKTAMGDRRFGPQPRGSLSSIIMLYKGSVTRIARKAGFEGKVWQNRYYDRIIRSGDQLTRTRQYIKDNPSKWDEK